MGIFLTLLYIFGAYLAPVTLYGAFAQYHIQTYIAFLCLVLSCLKVSGSHVFRMPQTYALIGFLGAVYLSLIVNGLATLVTQATLEFVPVCMVFFFIFINFRTRRHLQYLVATLFFSAAIMVYNGSHAVSTNDAQSPWVLIMKNSKDEAFFRIRGLGFLSDPNDTAQFLLTLLPCLFVFWQKKKGIRNLFFVYLPCAILLYGMFLTHSRGIMVALLVAAFIAGRKKIGVVPSSILAGLIFVGLSAAGWSGGRDVSAGEDRMEAWSTGLQLFRTHLALGVGYNRFPEYFDVTAHNTVVVCAAEVGLIGLFFWMMFIMCTMRDITSKPISLRAGEGTTEELDGASDFIAPSSFEELSWPGTALIDGGEVSGSSPATAVLAPPEEAEFRWHDEDAEETETLDPTVPDAELQRLRKLMVVSMAGFLSAGWFLSRSYTMVLFLNVGMASSVYRMSLDRGLVRAPLSGGKAASTALIASVTAVSVVYVMLLIDHVLPH